MIVILALARAAQHGAPLQSAMRAIWLGHHAGGATLSARSAHIVGHEIGDLAVEGARDADQGRSGDTVDAFLVFLNLLKGDAEIGGDFCWAMPSSRRRARIKAPILRSISPATRLSPPLFFADGFASAFALA